MMTLTQTEAKLESENRATLVVELTKLALDAPDVPTAVSPILETLTRYTQAAGSAYFQASGEVYTARAAAGDMPSGPAMDAILVHGLPAETPLMQALKGSDCPLFFDDAASHAETAGFPELGVKSLAAAPVRDRHGKFLGAFLMHTFKCNPWVAHEADLFATVAGVLASLAARLVAEENAVYARENAIHALGLALEYRDDDTKGHTDRVTRLALQTASEMGLAEADIAALRWGAYLHDIGKIAIPDAILHKPGKLDEAEWQAMKTHTTVGHTFADRLSFLPPEALEVVRHHHERWDGRGYPAGLAGEAIPLLARVFTVVDVYDALTSERPYKRAWTHGEAVAEIYRSAGTQFDPAVVDAFARAADAGEVSERKAA